MCQESGFSHSHGGERQKQTLKFVSVKIDEAHLLGFTK